MTEATVAKVTHPFKAKIFKNIQLKTEHMFLKDKLKEHIFYDEYLDLMTTVQEKQKKKEIAEQKSLQLQK